MGDQPIWEVQKEERGLWEGRDRKESKGLEDGEETLSRVEKEIKLNLARERNKGSGERKTRQVGFRGKGRASTVGLSIHLSPEYLKELKCKSQKLNPWA